MTETISSDSVGSLVRQASSTEDAYNHLAVPHPLWYSSGPMKLIGKFIGGDIARWKDV